MKIVLIGYRGTGKSTVAGLVAARLGWEVISTDSEIVKMAGCPIPEIVAKWGWEHFRSLETTVCREVRDKGQVVVDTGGGIIVKEENLPFLKSGGLVYWLTATIPTIAGRIGGDTQRPSLTGTQSFIEEIEQVLKERTPKYQALADHCIPTDTATPQSIASHILELAKPLLQE